MPTPPPPESGQWKPGESGNPAGKPKGRKSLLTIIRELEQEDYDYSLMPLNPTHKAKVEAMGVPWRAIMLTQAAKAIAGDTKAAEWLRKAGYGDHVTQHVDDDWEMSKEEADQYVLDSDKELTDVVSRNGTAPNIQE